jgi:hypothetical protein
MELVLKYLENAVRLRNLALSEVDPKLRAHLEKQAEAYRQLAEERAEKHNIPLPGATPK